MTFREMCIRYAEEKGSGLPLSAQEYCNAVYLWAKAEIEKLSASSINEVELNGETEEIDGAINYKITVTVNDKTASATLALTPDLLFGLIKGSDTVVVDIAEDGKTLEIHLDGDVLNKLDRAVLIPVGNIQEDSVPVVSPNKEVTYKKLSELGGGGTLPDNVVTTDADQVITGAKYIEALGSDRMTCNEEADFSGCSLFLSNYSAYVGDSAISFPEPVDYLIELASKQDIPKLYRHNLYIGLQNEDNDISFHLTFIDKYSSKYTTANFGTMPSFVNSICVLLEDNNTGEFKAGQISEFLDGVVYIKTVDTTIEVPLVQCSDTVTEL